jgi:hypothetical protein
LRDRDLTLSLFERIMTITTPSGYEANFIDVDELTYGQRRKIQRILFKNTRASYKDTDIIFDSQDEIIKLVLISVKVNGKLITENPIEEVLSWKNVKDGEAVFAETSKYVNAESIFGIDEEKESKKK